MRKKLNRLLAKTLATAAIVAIVVIPAAAWAQGAPAGLNSITEKADQIRVLFRSLAGVIVAIGAIWSGVKFVKGDPDAWGYIWKFGLGAVLVFAAPDVVRWLAGG